MDDGDTPKDQSRALRLTPQWIRAWNKLGWTELPVVLAAALIYVLTPLVILVLFGIRIAGWMPFWIAGVIPLLLLTAFFFIPDPEEVPLFSGENPSLLSRPWLMLRLSMLTAIVTLTVAFGSYALFHWTATSLPLALQYLIFGYCVLFILIFSVVMSVEGGQRWTMMTWTSGYGRYAPISVLASIIVLMTSFFASVTFVLHGHHLIQLHEISGAQPTVDTVSEFYLWHFLDSIPFLEVTKTIRWEPPISYQDTVTGVLVVCYKIAVIVPVISMFVFFWRNISRPANNDTGTPTGPPQGKDSR
jgi:hypothetical protein